MSWQNIVQEACDCWHKRKRWLSMQDRSSVTQTHITGIRGIFAKLSTVETDPNTNLYSQVAKQHKQSLKTWPKSLKKVELHSQ